MCRTDFGIYGLRHGCVVNLAFLLLLLRVGAELIKLLLDFPQNGLLDVFELAGHDAPGHLAAE